MTHFAGAKAFPMKHVAILITVMVLGACNPDRVTGVDSVDRSSSKAPSSPATVAAARPIMFHGGRVITNGLNIYSIYWASTTLYKNGPLPSHKSHSSKNDNSIIGHFLRNIGGSPWLNILTSYHDNKGVKIPNKLTYTGWWALNQNVPRKGSTVYIADIAKMLEESFRTKKLTYNANTMYTIFTGEGVNLGGNFGTSYCAFHTAVNIKVGVGHAPVMIIGIPYVWQEPWRCTAFSRLPSPNNQPDADGAINVLAHEIIESATNGFGRAWYDETQREVADKCVWNFGTERFVAGTAAQSPNANMTLKGVHYLVQNIWANSNQGLGGCVNKL